MTMITKLFRDRGAAGQALAQKLAEFPLPNDALVLALPRGGIPVAHEVAKALDLELDVLNLRKLGLPNHPEVAMGAIAEDGTKYLDRELINRLRVTDEQIRKVEAMEQETLSARAERFRKVRPAAGVTGRTVIVVDDGIATGTTMELAIRVLKKRRAGRLIVAVPVGPVGTAERFSEIADQCICLLEPKVFTSVGLWYLDFHQVPEERVIEALRESVETHSRHVE